MVLPSFLTVLLSSITTLPSFLGSSLHNPNAPIAPQVRAEKPTDDISSLVAHHLSLTIIGNLTQQTYTASQPSDSQRAAWRKVVGDLLDVADGSARCSDVRDHIPYELKGIYTVKQVDLGRFCALVEVDTVDQDGSKIYGKGWGLFVVPTQKDAEASTSVHVSAPRPIYELYTAQQAAFVFEWTGAKSLYIPGRSYKAFLEQTDCVVSTGSEKYWKTDAIHDEGEMMFTTYEAVLDHTGPSSAYVQFRGKAQKTCKSDQIFVSAGIGRDRLSKLWYNDHDQSPFGRLFTQLKQSFPKLAVNSPIGSACSLTATENIIGRLVNGVPAEAACTAAAYPPVIAGSFIHVQQNVEVRQDEGLWDTWADAFTAAFGKA